MKKYARRRGVPKFVLDAVDRDIQARVERYGGRAVRAGSGPNAKRLAGAKKLLAQLQQYRADAELSRAGLESWWPYDSELF